MKVDTLNRARSLTKHPERVQMVVDVACFSYGDRVVMNRSCAPKFTGSITDSELAPGIFPLP